MPLTHYYSLHGVCTDFTIYMYYDDTLATMTKASVSHLYPPALSTAWPGGTHIELESEVKISLTESWIVASHRPTEHTERSHQNEQVEHKLEKLTRHLRGVSRRRLEDMTRDAPVGCALF
jgi:hypothetical protein